MAYTWDRAAAANHAQAAAASKRKCAALLTLTGPLSSYSGARRVAHIANAQCGAYHRAMRTGVWA